MSDLNSSILGWLETSGRALELRVARTLQQIGQADVQPAFNYQDTVSGQARESDVVARFAWTGMDNVACTITVAVECKSSTKHSWVAFLTDAPVQSRPNLEEWAVFAHGPFVGVTEPLASRWAGQPPFETSPAASHVVAAHTADGKNPAGDAVRQALSCAAAIRQDYILNQATQRVGLVCLAAVVTAAPLFTCRLDATGSVILDEVEGFDVWGYGVDGARHRVYVRSERALPDFAEGLLHRAEGANS